MSFGFDARCRALAAATFCLNEESDFSLTGIIQRPSLNSASM